MGKFVQFALLVLSLSFMQTSCSHRHQNRREKSIISDKDNICEIDRREISLHCYCDGTGEGNATKADCWVFSELLEETDPIWRTFKVQPNIKKLSISMRVNANLRFVPINLARNLKKLENLAIRYATLKKIHKQTFSHLPVKSIKLMDDKITELDILAFADLPKLENLTLRENELTEIQRDVFVNLPKLKSLDLSINNISILHVNCFSHLLDLKHLILETNSITTLTKDIFKGLGNLTRLDLRSNKLSVIRDITFSEMWNLVELLLDNNLISHISKRAFDGLTMLKKLTMTGNQLKMINERLLEGIRGLELFDVRNNELEYFTYETLQPVIENLNVLYLSGNKLTCDCRLSWLQVLRNETKSEPMQLALSKVTCVPDYRQTDKVINFNELHEDDKLNDDDYGKLATPAPAAQLVVVDIPVEALTCANELGEGSSLTLSSKVNGSFKLLSYEHYIVLLLMISVMVYR